MYIVVTILALVLLSMLIISFFLVRLMSHPKFYTPERTIEIERGKGYFEGFDLLQREDYSIASYDGYELHATVVPYPNSKKYIIITHGHSYTKWGSIKYLMLFRKLGYNAVIYDDRGHGVNKKYPVSMGFRESKDLISVIEDTKRRFGADCYIGLHGESMGSAISLQALSYHPDIHFIVSDCGYSDLLFFTRMYITKGFHLPKFLVSISNVICKISCGYYLKEVSPISQLADNNIPICFIHGAKDKFIDCCNAKRMYEADHGYKELHLFEDADHAASYGSDPQKYFLIVKSFLEKVEKADTKNEQVSSL